MPKEKEYSFERYMYHAELRILSLMEDVKKKDPSSKLVIGVDPRSIHAMQFRFMHDYFKRPGVKLVMIEQNLVDLI